MMYKDWQNEKVYATKEEAKKDYINTMLNSDYYLAEIAYDFGPGLGNITEWLKEKGMLKDLYLAFKDWFDEGAEKFAEAWLEDLEEIEDENN